MNNPMPATNPVILQIVGYKNSGKTTLITELIRHLKQANITIGTVKHDAHQFQMDYPGTDTWKHQEAGADVTAISSSTRSAILRSSPQPLSALIEQMKEVTIVLVEGFKQEPYPKLVLLRTSEDFELLHTVSNPIAAILWPQAIESLPPSERMSANIQNNDNNQIQLIELSNFDAIFNFVKSFIS
ncbi:molybdopterin-guanine dinucleotide biosynthesis protein B [Paenibacillus solisilvae]|uniref:Molybdopterin-guanine dinucleotide biosynthesis protein B n=1 Tax=Paenibacillus solisilvae TaxID=2486751 RepID=A0ABW0W4G5_9BACL